jgi:hypothetical protein
MNDIQLVLDGDRVILDFGPSGLSSDSITDRVTQVLPLIFGLTAADSAWQTLKESEQLQRARAFAAMNMMCEARITAAIEQARVFAAVTAGTIDIASTGFPEFQEGGETPV